MVNDENKNIDKSPEHIPEIPMDAELQRQKEEIRKLAKKMRDSGKAPEPIIVVKGGGVKKASELTYEEQTDEIIKCASNPIYFIETYLTIFDQTKGKDGEIVPFKLFEFQKRLVNDYMNNRFVVANKYRQAGISTTTCAYIAWYVMFKENRSVAIVADKLETARDELMNDVVEFINNCPDWLRPKPDVKDTQKLKRYDNGCQISAFSSKGLRGYTPTLLFWDETAWTEKSNEFWTSAGPTLQTGGGAIFVSCVTKDSYMFTDKGIKQVRDYINNENLGIGLIDDTYLLGTKKTRKTNIIFKNGYVDTLKIKTPYSTLESSKNHKYWAYKDGKYDWFKANELKIGDYISIQYGMDVWGDNDDCSDFEPTKSNYVKNIFKPDIITKDIAYLIGLYISEGCAIKRNIKLKDYYGITITCGDDLKPFFDKLNLSYSVNDDLHYYITQLNVSEFFEYLGFDLSKKAPHKTIPQRVLEMSRDNMIAMVQGIMDGDGWATYDKEKNKLRVGIGLSSHELIDQIRMIFNNFGILTEHASVRTKPTKKIKVWGTQHRIVANNGSAKKYFNEIGFRFHRKNIVGQYYDETILKHKGVRDNIPSGSVMVNEIYENIKSYGLLKILNENDIKITHILQRLKNSVQPVSRKTILKLIEFKKDEIDSEILKKYDNVIDDNIVWIKIKSIDDSKNWTYDFSMSNDNDVEENEHHMSLIYNGFITHQTPAGLDAVFYKTFEKARAGENNFKAVELWWFNDPRYNKDLEWVKNKGKEKEIRMKDDGWTDEQRIKLMDDGWEATSPWFEEQVRQANGDMRKIAQEILCSFLGSGNNFIAEEYLKRIEDEEITTPLRQEYTDLNMWIFEDPIPGEDYLMGIDASPGHGEDNSTINILKINTIIEEKIITKNGVSKKVKLKRQKAEQVAEYYGKVTPQMLAEIAYQYGKRYNDAYAVIDITGGYGVQTVEKLIEVGYEKIHYADVKHKPSRDRLQGYIKKGQKTMPDGSVMTVDLIPGFYIGNNRASVLLEMQRAVHLEDVVIRSVRLLSEMKTFITVPGNRVADHKRTFHDDSIMGLSIALYVLNFDMELFKQNAGANKKMLDAMLMLNDPSKMAEMEEKIRNKKNEEGKIQKIPPKEPPKYRNDDLNRYIANSWLFDGLRRK